MSVLVAMRAQWSPMCLQVALSAFFTVQLVLTVVHQTVVFDQLTLSLLARCRGPVCAHAARLKQEAWGIS